MYNEPMILPLDANGQIYALQDEKGNTIGTGTREVCEVLLYIITKPASQSISGRINVPAAQRPNVRAAIAIWAIDRRQQGRTVVLTSSLICAEENDEVHGSWAIDCSKLWASCSVVGQQLSGRIIIGASAA